MLMINYITSLFFILTLLVYCFLNYPAEASNEALYLPEKGVWLNVRSFTNFSSAKAATTTSNNTIIVPPGSYSCNDLTIPQDRIAIIQPGAIISVNKGKTLIMPIQ